ncbi:MAG: AMP-binding protein [Pseudohongiellaceae bacterium]
MSEKLTGELDPRQYSSLTEVLHYFTSTHANRPAYSCFGKTLSFTEVGAQSDRFANYLINEAGLKAGERIAIQLPNVLQFPVAVYGAMKAGLVVVNTNPLYTKREMLNQFADSGVTAIVILANFCDKLAAIIDSTEIKTVIVTEVGDLQRPFKRAFMNFAARYIKKMVPAYRLTDVISFQAIIDSAISTRTDFPRGSGKDIALILYTGGTTGAAKGVMLSHDNLIANMMQMRYRCLEIVRDGVDSVIAPLPLYHTYAFLFHCLTMAYGGNHNVLITNPRDLDSLIGTLKKLTFQGFIGINTLYLAMLRHPEIREIDFSHLRFSGAGGMALSPAIAEQWRQLTGCEIFEGYGLTECSPVVSVNPPSRVKLGTVGPPVPETEVKLMDDDSNAVSADERGELWIRGPQVMLGYWKRDKETAEVLTGDGWFKSGDYATIDSDGYIKIVDRKKDMILVSGFNVFPAEVEEVVNEHGGVIESAAIGVVDERTGEAIKLFVVRSDPGLAAEDIKAWCKERLTPYKIPSAVVFVRDLPKSNVGKVLRRELKENEPDSTTS